MKMQTCPYCHGTQLDPTLPIPCYICEGTGTIPAEPVSHCQASGEPIPLGAEWCREHQAAALKEGERFFDLSSKTQGEAEYLYCELAPFTTYPFLMPGGSVRRSQEVQNADG